jgi:hypothetical protein
MRHHRIRRSLTARGAAARLVAVIVTLAAVGAAGAETPAGVPARSLQPAAGRTVIADTTLVTRAEGLSPQQVTLADLGEEEAANIKAINATRGTYQSYLLYTWPALPTKLFHPGFTITLGPPSKKALHSRREEKGSGPFSTRQPAVERKD